MTYENAYQILSEVRRGINEYSTAYVQGTDTSGAFANDDLFKKINAAQKFLFDLLVNREPQLFYKTVTLSPVSGITTLPADFYRLRRLENDEGRPASQITLEDKRLANGAGNPLNYYWSGGSLYIDDEVTDPYTLYYVARPREIHSGMSSAGAALSLTLESPTAKKVADYYNGMSIENVTDDWVDTISDYSAARVATLAVQTGAASKYYGLIPDLPEVFHPFIARKAVFLMQSTYNSLKGPAQADLAMFADDLAETLKSFFGVVNTGANIGEIFQ